MRPFRLHSESLQSRRLPPSHSRLIHLATNPFLMRLMITAASAAAQERVAVSERERELFASAAKLWPPFGPPALALALVQ